MGWRGQERRWTTKAVTHYGKVGQSAKAFSERQSPRRALNSQPQPSALSPQPSACSRAHSSPPHHSTTTSTPPGPSTLQPPHAAYLSSPLPQHVVCTLAEGCEQPQWCTPSASDTAKPASYICWTSLTSPLMSTVSTLPRSHYTAHTTATPPLSQGSTLLLLPRHFCAALSGAAAGGAEGGGGRGGGGRGGGRRVLRCF